MNAYQLRIADVGLFVWVVLMCELMGCDGCHMFKGIPELVYISFVRLCTHPREYPLIPHHELD